MKTIKILPIMLLIALPGISKAVVQSPNSNTKNNPYQYHNLTKPYEADYEASDQNTYPDIVDDSDDENNEDLGERIKDSFENSESEEINYTVENDRPDLNYTDDIVKEEPLNEDENDIFYALD